MRPLLLFLLLLATAYLGLVHPQVVQRKVDALLGKISKDRDSSQPMTVSRAYLLQQDKQLIFPITPGAEQLKIISNASLPMPTNTALPLRSEDVREDMREEMSDEVQCGYALEYALTREGEVLRSGVYHFLTTLPLTPDNNGTLRAQAFFDERSLLPMDSRILDIDLHGLPREDFPETIQFRLHSIDEPCTGAVLRFYAGTEASEQQLSFLWERLNQSQREKYARGNVYPAVFLTEEESTNALRIQFDPLAPDGIAGRDYTVQRLHMLQENANAAPVPEPDSELPSNDLLRADQQLRLTIPLPEQGARLKLLFTPANGHMYGKNERRNSLIKVNWYGLQSNERRQWSLPWQNEQAVLEDFFASGLLEVIADLPIQAKVEDFVHESPYTWTPLRSRMFLHGKGQPAIFKIQHLDKQATPFRCTFRRIFPQGGSQENPQRDDPSQEKEQQISYSLLNKESRELRSGTLTLHFTDSVYDLIGDRYPELLLSEPQRRFFLLPPEVDRVVFSTQEELLIAGANHPPDIPKRIRVPDDYLRKEEPGKRLWTWFPVLPEQREAEQRESFLVSLQARPPEDNEAVRAGQYLWESYRPAKDWAGHYLLEPREVGSAVRQEATDALFRVLPLNRAISINLKGKFPAAKIRPRLIFSKKDRGAGTLRLSVDGGKAIEVPLWGQQGILPLPFLATGKRIIRCTSSTPLRILLSNCVNRPSHLLRFANKLTNKGLTFVYEKKTADEELLSMRYYPGHAAASEIHAQLLSRRTSSGPFEQLSADHRVYLVRAAKEFPLLVLHRKEHAVAQGERLFFRLGSDLPAGSYLLKDMGKRQKTGVSATVPGHSGSP